MTRGSWLWSTTLLLLAACATSAEAPPTGSATSAGVGGSSSSPSTSSGAGAEAQGGAADGGAAQGGTSQGGSNQTGSGQGGSNQGGSNQGGSNQGGFGQGGGSTSTGAGGSMPTGTALAVVLRGTSEALSVSYDGQSWSAPDALGVAFAEASLARTSGGALAVGRVASANMAQQNELYALASSGATFGTAAPVGSFGFANDGPAASAHGIAELVTFLGTDSKHYFTQRDGGVFGSFQPLPGGSPGTQAFGPSQSALVSLGVAVFAAHNGDDGNLYGSDKASPGGVFSTTTQLPLGATVNKLVPPTGLVASTGELVVYFVRNADGRIGRIARNPSSLAWGAAITIHPDAITDRTPSVARLANGEELVVWHGSNNEGIYATRGAGSFGMPFQVFAPSGVASAPVALPAIDANADAEVLFSAGSELRHARIDGTTVSVAVVAGATGAVGVAAVALP